MKLPASQGPGLCLHPLGVSAEDQAFLLGAFPDAAPVLWTADNVYLVFFPTQPSGFPFC